MNAIPILMQFPRRSGGSYADSYSHCCAGFVAVETKKPRTHGFATIGDEPRPSQRVEAQGSRHFIMEDRKQKLVDLDQIINAQINADTGKYYGGKQA